MRFRLRMKLAENEQQAARQLTYKLESLAVGTPEVGLLGCLNVRVHVYAHGSWEYGVIAS